MIKKIIIVICLIVFCGSGYFVLQYVIDNMSAQKTIDQVADTRSRGLDKVYEQNNDLVGWVCIEDTKIDYPVMQTPQDPEFYLHMDFNKEYADSGTPFLDAASKIAGATEGAEESTWNWLVYGHHMKYGTMFHDLLEFESKDFWEEHKTFQFDHIVLTRDSNGSVTGASEVNEDFEIIAAGYSQIYPESSDAFKYYEYAGYFDEDSFNEFITGVKAESCYDTGVTAAYGDQLVTLSTCAYQVENGRFYLVGKRVQ